MRTPCTKMWIMFIPSLRLGLLLIFMYMQQVQSATSNTARRDPLCRQANYEYGCKEGGCEFSVGWRRETELGVYRIAVTALVPPEPLEEDVSSTAALTLAGSSLKGVFICGWSKWGAPESNCSLVGEVVEEFGCLATNVTRHNPLLECSFLLPENKAWWRLTSHPVSLHISSSSGASVHQASSECLCDLSDCMNTCGCSRKTVYNSKCHSTLSLLLIRSHAILMVVTFLLLLPTGVAISRYSRHIFPRSWFRAHAVTNSTAVMFLLLALTAILGHTGGDFKVGVHQVIGVICISLVLFQAMCGFLRPTAGISLQRRIFSIIHRTLGIAILGMGTLTMLLGAIMYRNSVYVAVVVVLVVALLVGVVLVAMMEIVLRRNHLFSPPVGYQRVEGGGGEVGEEGESESDRELFVKGRTSGGQVKIGTEKNLPLKPVQEHTTTKRLLTVFIIQAFIFSAVIGSLILYGDH